MSAARPRAEGGIALMTHASSPSTGWRPAPDVVARQMPGGAVLVHLRRNQIFELNETGGRIWALMVEGRSSADIISVLTSEFAVTPADAERELLALADRLAEAGLVQR